MYERSVRTVRSRETRAVGTHVHQVGNRFSRSRERVILQYFPEIVEEHHGRALRPFAYREGAQGRDRHQEVLVEKLSPKGVTDRDDENPVSGQEPGRDEHGGHRQGKRGPYEGVDARGRGRAGHDESVG